MAKNEDGEFQRTNGFEWPFDTLQMISWIMFSFMVFSFFLVVMPLETDNSLLIGISVVYALLLLAVVLLAARTSALNPVDRTIDEKLQATPRDVPTGDLLYCSYCKCKVHKRSKHCRLCNKCIRNFDHHCKWLNNCVGSVNYGSFFTLICITFLFTLLHSIWSFVILKRLWDEKNSASYFYESLQYFRGSSHTGLMVLVFISFVVAAIACLLLLQLVLFHTYLMYAGMSTYDYILSRRDKKSKRKDQRDNKNKILPVSDKPNRIPKIQEVEETSWELAEMGTSESETKGHEIPLTERSRGSALEVEGREDRSFATAKASPKIEEETIRDADDGNAASNAPREKKLPKLRPLPVKFANPN
mmetsp:Transcript_13162/g.30277  ORF Transcript_13162/g.30277 Transcript_13162/m.30277 type:complete len:359 (-) Transcript_13162:49-1125(-)